MKVDIRFPLRWRRCRIISRMAFDETPIALPAAWPSYDYDLVVSRWRTQILSKLFAVAVLSHLISRVVGIVNRST